MNNREKRKQYAATKRDRKSNRCPQQIAAEQERQRIQQQQASLIIETQLERMRAMPPAINYTTRIRQKKF